MEIVNFHYSISEVSLRKYYPVQNKRQNEIFGMDKFGCGLMPARRSF